MVIISLAVDVAFLPTVWSFDDPAEQAVPIIVGLSWRVVRVVNSESIISLVGIAR